LLQIRKLVSAVAVRLVFEPNDDTLEQQFLSLVNPILKTVQEQRGVIDFKVQCDNTINTSATRDQLELVGNIFIKPTLAAEYISTSFIVTPQGASFTDL
jgi:phage tail sheath protein FI